MKNKHLFSLLLTLLFAFALSTGVLAADEEAAETLRIASVEDFLAFAESCRLDSYSSGLLVELEADLDLRGVEFDGVPYFGGRFDGKEHSISGLRIDCDGSVQGLFRYVSQEATVENLHVQGSVTPGGSRSEVGGIVGENAGLLLNCSFQGSVSGGDFVGGIAGKNLVTGIVENCRMKGEVSGSHFVGGLVGENHGVIRSSLNSAAVNITAQQNSVQLEDVTLASLTSSESANTVTDVGGIAGVSLGVIRDAENRGNVGYRHMGYNIGGIAGTQAGYIENCSNYGEIRGRKEVGGIVGQMEPVSLLEYTKDALQILEQQLGGMSYLVNRTAANARSNAEPLYGQIGTLQGQTQSALEAIAPLIGNGIPDQDSITAAQNTLSSSLSAMGGTVRAMGSTLETTVTGLTQDVQALSGQIGAMGSTISAAKENLGGSITDISDEDGADDLSGKVENCFNHGSVLADLNVGGVVGAIAMENDLDLLEDLEVLGEETMKFESTVRAVLLNSENHGSVTGSKQHVGGIVGWQPLGLVRGCINGGSVGGSAAEYVGGIAGRSHGYLRACSANCTLTGSAYVGGIAGSAARATDCRSLVTLTDVPEKKGAVLGARESVQAKEDEVLIADNYYHPVAADIGAIDAISYAGLAEPMALEDFLALEELPEQFKRVKIHFLFADGSEEVLTLKAGSELEEKDFPAIPRREGYEAEWVNLSGRDESNILFDMSFEVAYTAHRSVIETQQTERGLSLLLLEGDFLESDSVRLEKTGGIPELQDGEQLLDKRTVDFDGKGRIQRARCLLPEDCDSERLLLWVRGKDGWVQRSFRTEKSYLIFDWSEGDSAYALVLQPYELSPIPIFAAAAVVLVAVIGLIRKKNVRKEEVSL